MIHLRRKFKNEPECYPECIYIMEHIKNRQPYKEFAQEFGLPIVELEPNNNIPVEYLKPCSIYVLDDFEEESMLKKITKIQSTWILGPTAFAEIALDHTLEIRSMPTYCTSMYGLCFYINCPGDVPLMKRMVKLIKWMGGMFVRSPHRSVTHMISTSTLAKGYIYCATFKVPVMTPTWVEDCWEMRHHYNFKAVAISTFDSCRLPAFAGLYICFRGFVEKFYQELACIAKANGAVTVSIDDESCTHVVFHDDLAENVNIAKIPLDIPYVVRYQWFKLSLEYRERLPEDRFNCFSHHSITEMMSIDIPKGCSSPSLFQKCGEIFVVVTEPPDEKKKTSIGMSTDKQSISVEMMLRQDEKRKSGYEELHLNEINYIKCLERLVNVWKLTSHIDWLTPDVSMPSNVMAKKIFVNLDAILKIHRKLEKQMEGMLAYWSNASGIGQAYISLKDEIEKEYVLYSSNFEEIQKVFQQCINENHQFKTSVEKLMPYPEDLFIRPIQRLGHTGLILSEIKKNTREDNPDKQLLTDAIDTLRDILHLMNVNRAKVDEMKRIFDIYYIIENCPPDLITSQRQLIVKFYSQEITNNNNYLGNTMVFFLFNDVLEVAKVRSKAVEIVKNGGNIIGHPEFHKKKPFKHIVLLPLSAILNVIEFEESYDARNLFGLNIQYMTREEHRIYCFQYLGEEEGLHNVLLTIAKQLSKRDSFKSPEDYIITNVPQNRLSIHVITNVPGTCASIKTPPKTDMKSIAIRFLNDFSKKSTKVKRSFSCSEIENLSTVL